MPGRAEAGDARGPAVAGHGLRRALSPATAPAATAPMDVSGPPGRSTIPSTWPSCPASGSARHRPGRARHRHAGVRAERGRRADATPRSTRWSQGLLAALGSPGRRATTLRSRRTRPRTPGDAGRGRAASTPPPARAATDQTARAGRRAGSIVDPAYLALVSDQALRTTVIAGRPDLGMPDWRELHRRSAADAPADLRRRGLARRATAAGAWAARHERRAATARAAMTTLDAGGDSHVHRPRCRAADSRTSRRGFLFKLGLALNVLGGVLVGIPVLGYLLGPDPSPRRPVVDPLGPVASFPDGETRLAIYENPFRVAWDGATAKIACWVRRRRGRAVPGLRDQLRAPRLPGALVRAVAAVHVPVPRRRLLRGRLARLRAAAAGPVRVRVRDPRGAALGARRAAPDPRRARCRARTTMASAAAHRSAGSRSAWGSAQRSTP